MPAKWTPEQTEKFRATMAAKRAAGWKPKKAKPMKKSGTVVSIPLDAVQGKKKPRNRKRAKREAAWPKHAMLHVPCGKQMLKLTIGEASDLYDALKDVFG